MTYLLRYSDPACAMTQKTTLRHNTLQKAVPQQKLPHNPHSLTATQQPQRTWKLAYLYLYFALQE